MRIVLVDPSRTMLKFVTRLLEARQHVVRGFTDPHQALDCLASETEVAALIASDELITMSGVELCWEARVLATARRPLYVILMSSHGDKRSLGEALDSGADDFISKPPIADELYARLRVAERLATMQRDLYRLATTDALTGALNRRAFFEAARDAARSAVAGRPLAAIMMDIDHFKRINDKYGHDVGDAAICAVVREAMAATAVLGRLGGEEFAALLPGMDITGALECAERLRAGIADLRIDSNEGPLSLSCSFGVCEWEPGDTIDGMLKRADVALYAAKSGGRNRVVAADVGFWTTHENPKSLIRTERARPAHSSTEPDACMPAELECHIQAGADGFSCESALSPELAEVAAKTAVA